MRSFILFMGLIPFLCSAQKEYKQSFFFKTGSHELSATQSQRINVLKKRAKSVNSELYLYGFADANGANKSNISLAKRRVKSISNVIEAASYKLVKEKYLGEDSLTHSSDSLNRRVDIVILDYSELYEKKSMKLKGCQFIPGKYVFLNEKAEEAVERLAAILKENLAFKIMIEGHVCCGPDQTLSNNRAIRVHNYLVDLGIDKSRMQFEGFSNTRPRVKEINDRMMQFNRRVEVRLLD
jgi:outer membrane protein OmpA-like peptidoglycan-associated protein